MVKVLSSNASKMYRNSEQYSDCSNLLMKADDPPLEELDPAILSCGLPAIILSEVQPAHPPSIRYSIGQLQTIRKSPLCSRRPLAADDPKVSAFAIWRSQPNRSRSSKAPAGNPQPTNDSHKEQNGATSGNNNTGNKEKSPEQQGGKFRNNHHTGRENGFVGSRYRRNYEFSNNNHYAIVKSYRSDGDQHHFQNTVIEEEPEWVSAGPTSRLDTIELRGFDDDLSVSQSSSEKANNGDGKNTSKNSGKHISFYDELHHYEHVHPKKSGGGGSILKPHDSSGRENDADSVTTSNTGSPPPARSTPTKHLAEFNHMMEEAQQRHNSGVNVNNFEEFMKFDSLLGSESAPGSSAQSGSRFSKWFRRGGNSFNPSVGENYDARRHAFHLASDNFAHGNNNRYPGGERNYTQQYPPRFSSYATNQGSGDLPTDSNSAFKRLVDMMAQNRANNNLVAQQQQYLLQMLNKNQQSEILRRMLIKNTVDNASDANQQQQQQPTQTPRVPTQLELQLHTQSIMQNALLRKKLQDQRKVLLEHNSQIAEMAAAAAVGKAKPNAEVQQFVKSVSPNIQRSLSLLSQTTTNNGGGGQYRSFNQTFPGGNGGVNNPAYAGGSHHPDLSASLRQMLLPHHQQQQQQGSGRPFGNRRRFEKRSVTWKHPNN